MRYSKAVESGFNQYISIIINVVFVLTRSLHQVHSGSNEMQSEQVSALLHESYPLNPPEGKSVLGVRSE